MKIPFSKYIQALLVARTKINDIYRKVADLQVPMSDRITEHHITTIYHAIGRTNTEYFTNVSLEPDPEWLRSLGIHKMVAYLKDLNISEGTLGIRGAFEMVHDRNMYEICTSLGLAKVNDEDIDLLVNGKYNIHYTKEDIKEFLNYFFCTDDWTLSDKKEYLNIVIDPRLIKFYKQALEGDKDYLIWKLGIAPDKSFDEMLRAMMSDAYYFFKEQSRLNPEQAQRWGGLALRISERLSDYEAESSNKKSLFDEIKFSIEAKRGSETLLLEGPLAPKKNSGPRHIDEVDP